MPSSLRRSLQWSQTLDTISLFISTPPNVTGSQCLVTITSKWLKIGIRGWSQLYIDEALTAGVDVGESTWSWIDGELAVDLCKVARGLTWESPLIGKGGLDPVTREEVRGVRGAKSEVFLTLAATSSAGRF